MPVTLFGFLGYEWQSFQVWKIVTCLFQLSGVNVLCWVHSCHCFDTAHWALPHPTLFMSWQKHFFMWCMHAHARIHMQTHISHPVVWNHRFECVKIAKSFHAVLQGEIEGTLDSFIPSPTHLNHAHDACIFVCTHTHTHTHTLTLTHTRTLMVQS